MQLSKALYGCLKSARLFYDKLRHNLEEMGFKVNPYDNCVANKVIQGTQCTIVWHVDDLKISHAKREVVDDILNELKRRFGALTVEHGKEHTYVGMKIIYDGKGNVQINSTEYIKEAINDFNENVSAPVNTPAANYLFEVDDTREKLDKAKQEKFHSIVAKLLFVARRGRPDILVSIAFLTTRVSKPDTDDWKKLHRLMQYLNATMDLSLTLSAENFNNIKWWVDVSYGTHADMRSHTGAGLTLGRGFIYSKSSKQKINTKSSTEGELVGASDMLSQIIWTRYFLAAQGYDIKSNVLFQDNQSAMLLEQNGKYSSSQRTRHVNIRYFFIKDRIASGEVDVKYCPTELMYADFLTKPLQGSKFIAFRDAIMGITPFQFMDQERVGTNVKRAKVNPGTTP